MSIEEEVFANYEVSEDRLIAYGFRPEGDLLVCTKPLPAGELAIIVTYDGAFHGRIMDLSIGEEYTNYRRENAAGYGAAIRQQFIDLLLDVREQCCQNLFFRSGQAQRTGAFLCEAYGGTPEFLWPKFPSYAVFRDKGSGKWYAFIGSVPLNKLDRTSDCGREIEVLNVKADSARIPTLLTQKGFYPAYHMNKKHWVSILLNDTLEDAAIQELIQRSRESV